MAIDTIARALSGQASATAAEAKTTAEQAVSSATSAVPDAVTSWLNANVDPVGSAVVVDSSLSISGAAADAKATGDGLADLKSAIYYVKPLPEEFWERKAYAAATGTASDSTQRISTKNYISKALVTVKPDSDYSIIVFAWDNSDNYVGGWTGSAWATSGVPWLYSEVNLKTLPGNYNLRIMLRQTNNNTITTSAYNKVVFGFYSDPSLSYDGPAAESKSTGEAIISVGKNPAHYDKSRNKYNPNSSLISTGYWTEGGKNSSTSSRVTHPIFVVAGIEYKSTHPTSYLGSNNNIAIVDGNGSEIVNRLGDFKGTVSNQTITFTPTFNGYVSLNIGNLSDDDFVISESNEYPNNGQIYSPDYTQEYNPLIGKKLSVNGDSICAGAGFAGGYAKIIGKRNNMTVQNIAVNGATITSGTTIGGSNRHWISTSIVDMDTDADYIILEGGINDDETIIGANKIGTINPTDYTGPFDTTTFCGALDYMFQQAYERFPGKKIGFIIVHKVVQMFNSSTEYANNRYPYVVQACKKWGIPYIDLNSTTAPLGYIASLKSAYTDNGGGWHPNEAGYKAYYVPKIEAWMKTL